VRHLAHSFSRNETFYPRYIAINQQSGDIFISYPKANCIQQALPGGEGVVFSGSPYRYGGYLDGKRKEATYSSPAGLCYDISDDYLLVCDTDNNCLRRVQVQGKEGEVTTVCSIPQPLLVCVSHQVIIVASCNCKLYLITKDGTILSEQEIGCIPTGIMFHEPAHCFFVYENSISRVTFK